MFKKVMVCILTIVLVLSTAVCVFATPVNSVTASEIGGDITPLFISVSKVEFNLSFSGATAKPRIYVVPKSGVTIDRIVVNGKLMKVGSSTPIKTWNATEYPDILGDFLWSDSYTVTSNGTYYLSGTVKCYQGTTLLETISGESARVTY